MCKECGCGLPGENPVGISADHHEHDQGHGHGHSHDDEHDHAHEHSHGPGEHHGHDHDQPHTHPHTHSHSHTHGGTEHDHEHEAAAGERRTVEVRRAILDKNDRLAERNRGFFQARGLFVLNFLSSPGSGKTTSSARPCAPCSRN